VDLSIIRNFRLTRSKILQFRLEAFNVLNTPIWNDPNTTLSSPLYGLDHHHEKISWSHRRRPAQISAANGLGVWQTPSSCQQLPPRSVLGHFSSTTMADFHENGRRGKP
jgi:hypothetical protein